MRHTRRFERQSARHERRERGPAAALEAWRCARAEAIVSQAASQNEPRGAEERVSDFEELLVCGGFVM